MQRMSLLALNQLITGMLHLCNTKSFLQWVNVCNTCIAVRSGVFQFRLSHNYPPPPTTYTLERLREVIKYTSVIIMLQGHFNIPFEIVFFWSQIVKLVSYSIGGAFHAFLERLLRILMTREDFDQVFNTNLTY